MINLVANVVFVMTTYNRKSLTLKCLSDIESQNKDIKVVVVDDNSSDGTPELIEEYFPNVDLVRTSGENFWALGMKIGQDYALDNYPEANWIFFINDDVRLMSGVIQKVLEICMVNLDSVLVGSLKSPESGELTYGGLIKAGRHPLDYKLIPPNALLTEVDTFHGNFVAVPTHVLRRIGGLDGQFAHAYADFDLGLRLSKDGVNLRLLPFFVGYCSPNNIHATPRTTVNQLRFLLSEKGRPIASQSIYLRRHGPKFVWFIFVISPYVRVIVEGVKGAFGIRRWKN